jgi:TPR repeat protein
MAAGMSATERQAAGRRACSRRNIFPTSRKRCFDEPRTGFVEQLTIRLRRASQFRGNKHGGDELRLERPLGSNKEGLVLGEALYWMAEKLTWGYEDVEPDPVEALKLFRQSAELGFSDALIRIGQLQQQGKGTARDPKAALKNYLAAAKAGNFVALGCVDEFSIGYVFAIPLRNRA